MRSNGACIVCRRNINRRTCGLPQVLQALFYMLCLSSPVTKGYLCLPWHGMGTLPLAFQNNSRLISDYLKIRPEELSGLIKLNSRLCIPRRFILNAMSLHQEAFNHIPVNFYPKPRAMRNLDCAVFNFNSFTNKCITEKIFREIVLYHRLIREKCKWCGRDVGNKLQSGCNTDSGSPHMGDQLNHIRLSFLR